MDCFANARNDGLGCLETAYFVSRCCIGVTAVGAFGEIANVSHVLQPGADVHQSL
jgi:hypothetical protein